MVFCIWPGYVTQVGPDILYMPQNLKQSWYKTEDGPGSRVAGFRADCLYLMWGRFKIRTWKCMNLTLDNHQVGGFLRVTSIAWGGRVVIITFCPMVVLSVSSTSRAVTAMIQRQAGHPCTSFLDKYVTHLFHGPKLGEKFFFYSLSLIHKQIELFVSVQEGQSQCFQHGFP